MRQEIEPKYEMKISRNTFQEKVGWAVQGLSKHMEGLCRSWLMRTPTPCPEGWRLTADADDIGANEIYYTGLTKTACDEYRIWTVSTCITCLIKWHVTEDDLNEEVMRQISRNVVSRINAEELGSSLKLRKYLPTVNKRATKTTIFDVCFCIRKYAVFTKCLYKSI